MTFAMEKRVNDDDMDYDGDGSWWYSSAAAEAKWAIIGLIFLILFAYIFGGYFHAQMRAKKGLPPLAYHRWLLPARQRAQVDPYYRRPQNDFSFYQAQPYRQAQPYNYNMDAMPPPAYNPNIAPPPSYQPPMGASKTNPSQNISSMPPPMDGASSSSGEPSHAHHSETPETTAPVPAYAPPGSNPFL